MATRIPIIAGNWKMNYGPEEASSFAKEVIPQLGEIIKRHANVLTILCPPAISLSVVKAILDQDRHPNIELGAQNLYFEEDGAYTGEIAPDMVAELCTSVILGHSERRNIFGETDDLVNKKVLAAFKYNLRPIVCVGENLEQYEKDQTEQVIRTQLQGSLANLPTAQVHNLVVAYEPIWAIGSGKAATAEGAGQVIRHIRQVLSDLYEREAAEQVRILYGGSITSSNITEFMIDPEIDGSLVGGASLKPDFAEILSQSMKAKG